MTEQNNQVLEAFQRFHDMALEVAGECDGLVDKQREMSTLVGQVKSLVGDVRQLVTIGEVQDDGFQVHLPSNVYLRLTSCLAGIESALKLSHSIETVIGETVPVTSQPAPYTPSLSKR